MKPLFLVNLLFLFTGSIHAADLCDASCTLKISFPSGGSIEAVDPVEFEFGDGGLIDTAGSVTAYVDGEILLLRAGDTITFASGGQFDLGQAGNLNYTNIRVLTDGVMDLAPATAADSITFPEDTTLAMSPESTLRLSGQILNLGSLETGHLVILSASANPADPPQCQYITATDNSLTITAGTIATTDANALLATAPLPDCSSDFDTDFPASLVTLGVGSLEGFGGTLTPVDISIDLDNTVLVLESSDSTSETEEENAGSADRSFLLVLLFMAWLAHLRRTRTRVT